MPKPANLLIYGANGYTGELIARHAVQQGLRPILAGRTAEKISPLAEELDLEQRVFSLDDSAAIDRALADVGVALHCAGPFSHTAAAMVDACLRTQAHYLDITGEIAVFETIARRSKEAISAGVMLLPGAGFDVVPTDCLAAHLKRRMPNATQLTLAMLNVGGGLSRGTATTAIEGAGQGGAVRRDGKITRVLAAHSSRQFDFGRGPRMATAIPWGDVSTAFYSTGIPNIEVYAAFPNTARWAMMATRYFGWAVRSSVAQGLFKRMIQSQPPGPSQANRERGTSIVVGQVEDGAGNKMISRLRTPEGYKLTALSSVAIARRVLDGNFKPGFQTPSLAYGADFILEIPGVEREDVE